MQKIKLETWEEGYLVWMITVHRTFMINVTIHKGFVPFSVSCEHRGSHISLYEGHSNCTDYNCDNLIEWFCGHVHMEHVYSRGNEATLITSSDINNVPFPASICASYHVLASGVAHRFSISPKRKCIFAENPTSFWRSCFPASWKPFQPDQDHHQQRECIFLT